MTIPSRRVRLVHVVFALTTTALVAGCQLVGGALKAYRMDSTYLVHSEYDGLVGKSFGVVVSADRLTQADYPGVVSQLTLRLSEQIAQNVDAAGWIPGETMLTYQYENPRWSAKPLGELATDLGLERLVFVDLREFRLHEPGNQYLWSGVASGTFAIIEADSALPDHFAFEGDITVSFPDSSGYGPSDIPGNAVASELLRRFVDRCAWLTYDHQEPYYPKY